MIIKISLTSVECCTHHAAFSCHLGTQLPGITTHYITLCNLSFFAFKTKYTEILIG